MKNKQKEQENSLYSKPIRFNLKQTLSISLYFMLITVDQQVRCKPLSEEKQWPERAINQVIEQDRWIPLRDFKSVVRPASASISPPQTKPSLPTVATSPSNVETMKTSETLTKTVGVESQLPWMAASPRHPARYPSLGAADNQQQRPQHQSQDADSRMAESACSERRHGCQRAPSMQQTETAASVLNPMKAPHYRQSRRPLARAEQPVEQQDSSAESGYGDSDGYGDNSYENGNNNADNEDAQAPETLHGGGSDSYESASSPNQAPDPRFRPRPRTAQSAPQEEPDEAPEPGADEAAAEQNEQEAAEASEAEAANKAALDEQQQQQQEIIRAQAQSEAKAIKEQQEALMRQQRLHQKMVMQRVNDLMGNQSDAHQSNSLVDPREQRAGHRKARRMEASGKRRRPMQRAASDIQFSDQQEQNQQVSSARVDEGANEDREIGTDYSVRKPVISAPVYNSQERQSTSAPTTSSYNANSDLNTEADLEPAAQHQYGSGYATLHGHQSHYYQYAESHKKGQYKAGFKRGNKKFQISGHSSQHKNHAEGHVKWNGKKGKGSHYWEFKHKDKKHHGHHY